MSSVMSYTYAINMAHSSTSTARDVREHALKAHATQSYSIVNHAYLLNDVDALGMGAK